MWTVAGSGEYTGKPRPVLIVQDDHFDTDSVTVCPVTTDPTDAPLFRLEVRPNEANGLDSVSRLMIDKLTTVHRRRLRARLGSLTDADLLRLNRAVVIVLGIAATG